MAMISQYHFSRLFGWALPTINSIPQEYYGPEKHILLSFIRCFGYKRILEIGVCRGFTSRFLLSECPQIEKYVGIDVPFGFVTALPIQQGEVQRISGELVLNDSRVRMLILPEGTKGMTEDIVKMGDNSFDLCFIDADHSYEGVKRDTILARRMVKSGGVIVWHDYNNVPGVTQFIDEDNTTGGDHIFLVGATTVCFSFVGSK